MKLFQMVIFTLVLFSNVRWHWIDNSYAATLGAAIVAYYATLILVRTIEAGFLGRTASLRLARTAARLERQSVARNSGLAASRRA